LFMHRDQKPNNCIKTYKHLQKYYTLTFVYVCMYMFIHTYIDAHKHTRTYIDVCVCLYVYLYSKKVIHILLYIYTQK
jgi:hypothetical protein